MLSKVKKVAVKKLNGTKLRHHSSLTLVKAHHSHSTLPQATENSELISESPYANQMSKIRSTSNLKDPGDYHTSGLASPPLHSKFITTLNSKINSISYMGKDFSDTQVKISKKRPICIKKQSRNSKIDVLESKIQEIKAENNENGISSEIVEKFRECLMEIIHQDKVFGPLIAVIKQVYEDWIGLKEAAVSEIPSLKTEIVKFSTKLIEEIEENKSLHRKIQKISRENVEMGRSLEESDKSVKMLREHLLNITNVDVNKVPKDEMSWKVLVAENENFSVLCEKLKKKLKILTLKEKKLMKLFWVMKKKGFPVEEIYENLDSKKASKDKESPECFKSSTNKKSLSHELNDSFMDESLISKNN